MSARPKSFKINGTVWTVEYLSAQKWHDRGDLSDDNCGETHPANHSICVVEEHPSGECDESTIKEVLLHEILHALFHTTSLGYTPINTTKRSLLEETIVAALSDPLLAVLRDNVGLRNYLFGK